MSIADFRSWKEPVCQEVRLPGTDPSSVLVYVSERTLHRSICSISQSAKLEGRQQKQGRSLGIVATRVPKVSRRRNSTVTGQHSSTANHFKHNHFSSLTLHWIRRQPQEKRVRTSYQFGSDCSTGGWVIFSYVPLTRRPPQSRRNLYLRVCGVELLDILLWILFWGQNCEIRHGA